jgi:hypothetical protein
MEPRRLFIRPSTPQAQRLKDANVKASKTATATRKLQKATTTPAKAADMRPADQRGFSQWWKPFYERGLMGGLDEDEVGALHALAWNHYHAVHPTNAWREAVAALVARRKAASPPEPADYWKRWRGYGGPNPRDDGW